MIQKIDKEGIKMKKIENIGKTDRIIRIVLAAALFSLFIFLPGSLKWLGLLGLIPLVTAVIGFCPLYSLFHLSTKEKHKGT